MEEKWVKNLGLRKVIKGVLSSPPLFSPTPSLITPSIISPKLPKNLRYTNCRKNKILKEFYLFHQFVKVINHHYSLCK
jgi:hypothetical protein